MKKLKKISLQNLVQDEMAKREQNMLKGGACACATGCGCAYAGEQSGPNDSYYGGSSTDDNADANAANVASGTSKN